MADTCENTHTQVGMYVHIMNEYRWLFHVLKIQNLHLLDLYQGYWYGIDMTDKHQVYRVVQQHVRDIYIQHIAIS